MLKIGNSALVIIDVQGKLANLMENRELLFENISRMIRGAKLLDIPFIVTEQKPDKLGPTTPEIAHLLDSVKPIEKESFSCCGSTEFVNTLRGFNRDQVMLVGIETHVCVYQTAVDLVKADYEVHIIADGVSSRTILNHEYGLERMKSEGVILSTTELVLFECIRTASDYRFRDMAKIIK